MSLNEFDSQDERLNSASEFCRFCCGSNAKTWFPSKQKNEICKRCGNPIKLSINFTSVNKI